MPELVAERVLIETAEDIDTIEPERWDALMRQCGASVFYRHSFLSAYQHGDLGSARAMRYLTCTRTSARDNGGGEDNGGAAGALLGALPAYLTDAAEVGRVLGIERLAADSRPLLMTHLPHCYDSTIPAPDDATRLVPRLWESLRALGRSLGAGAVGLLNVPTDDRTIAILQALPGMTIIPGASRWQLDLTQHADLDAFLRTMAKSTRRSLRLAATRSARAGVTCEARVYDRTHDRSDLADVVELCVGTAAKHGSAYYPGEPLRRFLTELDDFVVLRVKQGERTLAASVCLRERDTLHAWAGGALYPAELNWSPNHLLFYSELRYAFESGVRLLECGRRSDEFKARHRLTRKELMACLDFLD